MSRDLKPFLLLDRYICSGIGEAAHPPAPALGYLILYSHQIPSTRAACAISSNPSHTLERQGFLSPVYKGENGFPQRSSNFLKDKPLQNTKVCFTRELTFLPIMLDDLLFQTEEAWYHELFLNCCKKRNSK